MKDFPRNITDPVEKIVADALDEAGIDYEHESERRGGGLDFYLPQYGIDLEVKQFHTDRINNQMRCTPNVIVVQGMEAARAFAAMLTGEMPDAPPVKYAFPGHRHKPGVPIY